jgi:endonuclease YncB( thermonuclease family)
MAAAAAELRGRVVGISDGDTLTLLTDRRQEVRLRLAEIDTPERGQPYSERSRQLLSDLVYGKSVRVEIRDTDRYGRTVGRIYVGSRDINADMVRLGAA